SARECPGQSQTGKRIRAGRVRNADYDCSASGRCAASGSNGDVRTPQQRRLTFFLQFEKPRPVNPRRGFLFRSLSFLCSRRPDEAVLIRQISNDDTVRVDAKRKDAGIGAYRTHATVLMPDKTRVHVVAISCDGTIGY